MTPDEIKAALAEIGVESDTTLKHLKLASLVTRVFGDRGVELVVVGGSAIEFYTEGAYTSGDVDLCVLASRQPLTVLLRQQAMAELGGRGGPRSWQVAGAFVDVLGPLENLARTGLRSIEAPFGPVSLCPAEELIVERVLVSEYPAEYPPARECAKKMLAAALQGEVETDWKEVRRLARSAAYKNWPSVKRLIDEQAEALQVRSPSDSDQ